MMSAVHAWHRFAVRHGRAVDMVAVAIGLACLFDVVSLRINPDWLSLFDRTDPAIIAYRDHGAAAGNLRTLYVKIPASSQEPMARQIANLQGVTAVAPLPLRTNGPFSWLLVEQRVAVGPDNERGASVATSIEKLITDHGIRIGGVTGASVILDQFRDSVTRDFILTSLLSLGLVSLLVVLCFRRAMMVLRGVGYELLGLLMALTIFAHLRPQMNVLASALPCVLIGLGIDYVIHILATAEGAGEDDDPGVLAYRRLLKPMTWGAVTTAAAFLSLMVARLAGLRDMGLLGCLGIGCMFVCVTALLPPALSRRTQRQPLGCTQSAARTRSLWHPVSTRRWVQWSVFTVLLLCCALAACFVGRVRMEENPERLYDPNLSALQLQSELVSRMGVWPSILYFSFECDDADEAVAALVEPSSLFRVDDRAIHTVRDATGTCRVAGQLLSRDNPFAVSVYHSLCEDVKGRVEGAGGRNCVVTGDAAISHWMNALLMKGMRNASASVIILLAIVLAVAFRSLRFVLAPLSVLLLCLLSTLGVLGMTGITLSAYNLSLFPLLVGIGIDDCLYVADRVREGRRLADAPHTVKGITMTTLTTLLAYGSLIAAGNAGLVAMGLTALIGLTATFLCAIYLLPRLLET